MREITKIRIGTRGSALAMTQTKMVAAELARVAPEIKVEIVVIKTSGDWKPEHGEVRLEECSGGKAQFAKEIEEALLAGAVDIAVHSMKDMDSNLPKGLVINHMLPREQVNDVLIINKLADNSQIGLAALPQGAVVGTASVRRQAFIAAKRPDVSFVPLRGNVETRIKKLRAGEAGGQKVDATLLALAGLKRLGLEAEVDVILPVEEMLPCAGQGAIGIEMRAGEAGIEKVLDQISCFDTLLCVKAERAAVRVLDGTCHTPIGAYAHLASGQLSLRVRVASRDGCFVSEEMKTVAFDSVGQVLRESERVGEKLKATIPEGVLS